MAEYIEREAVLYVLDEAVKTWRPDIGISKAEYLRIRYENLPAADVRPVVRGKWQPWKQDRPPLKWYSCDYCGFHALNKSNFCPNCGAMMEES